MGKEASAGQGRLVYECAMNAALIFQIISLLSLFGCPDGLSVRVLRPTVATLEQTDTSDGSQSSQSLIDVADEEQAVDQESATYAAVAANTEADALAENPTPQHPEGSPEKVTDKEYSDMMRYDAGCDDQIKHAEGLPPTNLLITPKHLLDDGSPVPKGEPLKTKVQVSNDGPPQSDEAVEEDGDDTNVAPIEDYQSLKPTNRFLDDPAPSPAEEDVVQDK